MKLSAIILSLGLSTWSMNALSASQCFTSLVEVEDVADGVSDGDLNESLEQAADNCLSEALDISIDPLETLEQYIHYVGQCEEAWNTKSEISKKFCIMDAALQVQSAAYFNENLSRARE